MATTNSGFLLFFKTPFYFSVSFAYVFVTVNDSNDNAPVFEDTPYEEVIPESGYNDPIFTVKVCPIRQK